MKKVFYASLILMAGFTVVSCTSARTKTHEPKQLVTIVKNMADDGTVLDEKYRSFFNADSAREGVVALIQSGNYFVNEIPIPASAEAFDKTGFSVNENAWLSKNGDGSYTLDRTSYRTYIDGALAIIDRLPAGLETRLYDMDGDGYADKAEADYYDALIVHDVMKNADGTVTVSRASLENGLSYPAAVGRAYDGAFDTITVVAFDSSIKSGDVALLQRKNDGYHIKRAVEVRGVFTGGSDHKFYEIDGTRYQDAMRFSRDNIVISNRPGEYANVRTYFGFTGNTEPVSLWLSPVTESGRQGAPVSLTSGESAVYYLSKALETAKKKIANQTAPDDAKSELSAIIELSETALEKQLPNDMLDYHTYLLFLALHGSKGDIGAEYAGFTFAGFENRVK